MADFRNCVSVFEVAPCPAGLDDCLAGFNRVVAHASELKVDSNRVVVSGARATGETSPWPSECVCRTKDVRSPRVFRRSVPSSPAPWADERNRPSSEMAELLSDAMSNRVASITGSTPFRPLAWPDFATRDDVADFPPTIVSVNELDPLRDEGEAFYRLLLAAWRR